MAKFQWIKAAMAISSLAAVMMFSSGCTYLTSRYYDFRDTMSIGAGITAENQYSGMFPPALGLYLEATEFLQLGAIHFSGYSAEMELRGAGAGFESRTRLGIGPFQGSSIAQQYEVINFFKRPSTNWQLRMNRMRFADRPAKDLVHDDVAGDLNFQWFPFKRGWQYWGYIGGEAAICDPLLTHLGLTLRLGVDISEVSDFILGWFTIDFKMDDLTDQDMAEKAEGRK